MRWAFVCESETQILSPITNSETLTRDLITVPANTIVNIIEWDGKSEFEVPKGYRLEQIENDKQIGDKFE